MSSDGLTSVLFSMPKMANVFSPPAQLRAMMRFEWVLSSALVANSSAKEGSAAVLEKLLDADFVDQVSLLRVARNAGNTAIPFVRKLTAAVKAQSEIAARSVHLGATLVITGAHGPATPPADGRTMHAAIQHPSYVELKASHLSALESEEEFAGAVVKHLTATEVTRG